MTTRREALGVLGGAAGSMLVSSLLPAGAAAGAEGKPAGFPWPYAKIDPEAVAERGYAGYYASECMGGAFSAIIDELAAKQGAPFNTFPTAMMRIGGGGMSGWATLCGALNGSALAISLVSAEPKPIVDELFNWYQTSNLPEGHPKQKVRFEITTKSIAQSPLCHNSVSRWCEKANVKAFSKERAERCAWLTADCARKTVELLNAQFDKNFVAAFPLSKGVQECRSCHDQGSKLEDARGKMECGGCHFNLGTQHPIIERKL